MKASGVIGSELSELGVGALFRTVAEKHLSYILSDGEIIRGFWAIADGYLIITTKRLVNVPRDKKKEYTAAPWGNVSDVTASLSLGNARLSIHLNDNTIIRIKGGRNLAKPNLNFFTDALPRFLKSRDFSSGEIERATVKDKEAAAQATDTHAPANNTSLFRNRGAIKQSRKATEEYEVELSKWTLQHKQLSSDLTLAEGYAGTITSEILLRQNEKLYGKFIHTGLVESHSSGGHYRGGSAGISVPVGSIKGRSVRVRVGQSRGTYTKAAPEQSLIDRGVTYITDQRVIFQGGEQTRECLFSRLLGFKHDPEARTITFSLSSQHKPTTIFEFSDGHEYFVSTVKLATSQFSGTRASLVSEYKAELVELEKNKPQNPDAGTTS